MTSQTRRVWNSDELLAASAAAMAIVDEERYLSVNEAYIDVVGAEHRAELVGEAWSTHLTDEGKAQVTEALRTCRTNGEWTGEVTGYRQSDESFHLELSVGQLSDDEFLWVAHDTRGRHQRERELERYETIIETVTDGVYALDEELRFSFVNEALCNLAEVPRDELLGTPVTELFTYDDEVAMAEEIRERVVASNTGTGTVAATLPTSDGERRLEARYRLHPEPDDTYRGSIGIVRDVTEREDREHRLERQRDELRTLNRINELLLSITRNLFKSPTREEIEQTVCDHLASSDMYQFAWIGTPEPGGDRIIPQASAGVDDGYVETTTITATEGEASHGPGGRAYRTGELQVSQDIRTDPTFEQWREAALERDVVSAAAVPLVHDDTTYGILAVYATRPMAFSRRERAGFKSLGEAVGFAINAIENRKLLFADGVVELEFEVTDSRLLFVQASKQLDCELTVTGFITTSAGNWSVYVTVEGTAPAALREITADDSDVVRVKVLSAKDDEGLLEVVTTGPTLPEVTEHGAMLTAGTITNGRGRFTVEAPQSTDIRRLVDRFQSTYPDSTLAAQREYDRPVQTAGELRRTLDDRLTDRQREALERAYYGGYFDWPRASTASDIAASMDIAETTFHYHLRNSLESLLSTITDVSQQ